MPDYFKTWHDTRIINGIISTLMGGIMALTLKQHSMILSKRYNLDIATATKTASLDRECFTEKECWQDEKQLNLFYDELEKLGNNVE